MSGSVVSTAADAPGEALLFEIVTGFLASDSAFAPHGHTVRVSVSNAQVEAAAMQ